MKLSIIVPVYNVGEYIGECLDSILNQSFKDFEVICINDGSTDDSLEILEKYKEKDSRIIIIDKKNEGSGIARNAGIDIARGEYLFFIDGDDGIEENSIDKIIKKADELNTDILVFGGLSYYNGKPKNGGYSANKLPKKYLNKIVSANEIKKDIFKFPTTAWTKLYKHSLFTENNIRFQDIKVGQDQLPFFHSMIVAERIAIYPKNIYKYRKNRKGSAMTVKKKKNFSPIYVFYGIEDLLKNTGKLDDYKNIFINKYFSKATSWLGKFQDDLKSEYFEEYSKLLAHIKKSYPNGWWRNFNPSIKDGYWALKFKQLIAFFNLYPKLVTF